MVRLCTDYTNSQGRTYKGCGLPLKWENELPLQQVGEFSPGKPKYKGHYIHFDGSPARHDDGNPPNQKAYQQTYAPQIEQADKEQAKLEAAGYTDAKSSSMLEQFVDKKLIPTLERVEKRFSEVFDSAETKAASNNVGIVMISRDLGELQKKVDDAMDRIEQKLDAILKSNPDLFQGADKMYQSGDDTEVVESSL